MKARIKHIDTAWPCCQYKYRVFLTEFDLSEMKEIESILTKFFGAATFFWNDMWLCGLKNKK